MRFCKKLYVVLLLLLLYPLVGLAKDYYTLPQVREQVTRWQQTYTAHGRDIVIDVLPQVPEVDRMPMLEMRRLPLPITLPQEAGWSIHSNTQRGMDENPSYFGYDFDLQGEVPAVIDGKQVKYGPHRMYYGDVFEPEGRYIPGSDMTFGEISALLREALQRIGLPEGVIDPDHPISLNAHAYYGDGPTEYLAPGWGFFHYDQLVRGIPIHTFGLPAATDHENPSLAAHFGFGFHTPQCFNFGGYLLTESALLAEDVPLAAFGTVQQALGEEIMAGRLRHIFELRLCYAMACPPGYAKKEYYPNMDIPAYTVPVWVVDVLWTSNPRKALDPAWEEPGGYEKPDARNTLSYRRLMVNAQTGKLYDPQSRDRNRGFYDGFLSWDDVGGR